MYVLYCSVEDETIGEITTVSGGQPRDGWGQRCSAYLVNIYENTKIQIHTDTRNTYTQIQKYSHNLPAKRFMRATLLNFVKDTGVDGGPYAYVELCLQQTLDWRPICLCFSLLMAMTDSRLYHTTPYNTIPNQNIPCCTIQYHDW